MIFSIFKYFLTNPDTVFEVKKLYFLFGFGGGGVTNVFRLSDFLIHFFRIGKCNHYMYRGEAVFFARFDGEVLPILSVPAFYNVFSFNLVRIGRN